MHRRDVLEFQAVAFAVSTAGCLSSLTDRSVEMSDPSSPEEQGGEIPCDEYAYESDGSVKNDEYPWDLHIRNISLSTYSVSISITDLSGETPEEVVSCAATSEAHTEFVFGLSPDKRYRVHVTLNRPTNSEEAATTVSGKLRANEALEVSVERGEGFGIRRVHYDPSMTPTAEGE